MKWFGFCLTLLALAFAVVSGMSTVGKEKAPCHGGPGGPPPPGGMPPGGMPPGGMPPGPQPTQAANSTG